MIRNHQARAISRIGFVADEKNAFEAEIITAIENRAIQIGSNSSECLLEAERELAIATETAGMGIVLASRDWIAELNLIEDEFVEPTLQELDILISLFQVEVLYMLAYRNTVTEIEYIVSILYLEALLYEVFFELFVDEIIFEFNFFQMLANEDNGRLFQTLDDSFNDYITNGNIIRDSLATCNT